MSEDAKKHVDMMKEIETIASFEKRGPTKVGEKKAAEYLERRFEEMGLEPSVEHFKISPHYYWVYFMHMVLALAAGVACIWTHPLWLPPVCAGVLLLVIVSFWGDLTTKFHLIRNVIPRYPSQNVIGRVPKEGAKKKVFLTAHYDAAKAGKHVFNPDLNEALARFYKEKFSSTPNVMMPIIVCLFGLFLVAMLRIPFRGGTAMWIVTGIIQGLASLGVLIAAFSFFDIGTGFYVPGAIDNLSAVSACMSIAGEVLREPLENIDFSIVAVGCEEAIMMGMVQFMKRHSYLDKESTYFINLESLGNGSVFYGVSEGFVRVRPYSRELVRIAESLKDSGEFPELQPYDVRLGTDAMVPLVRGYKSISIFALNENNFCPYYHTPEDTPEHVDINVTRRARDLALRMLRELDGA